MLKGAFLISILLAAASGLFSMFISLSTRYSTVYGSLASVIILMLWLYLCGNIVNLGNVLNYVWWRRKTGAAGALPIRKAIVTVPPLRCADNGADFHF